jgi:hypothetical protein
LIKVFTGREILVALEMIGTERLGNAVFLGEPAAKVDQFAAPGAKRAMLPLKPGAWRFAGRATNRAVNVHSTTVNHAF